MLKRILLSGVALTFCAGMAVAQTAAPDQSTPPAAQGDTPMSAPGAAGADAAAGASASENQADASLFSNLKGADVVGSDSKEVGRLADILLDSQGNIQQIVIGSGGIAGVGETLHAYDQATLPTLNSDGKVELGLTTASLDSLPEYTYPEKVETGRATTGDAGGAMSSDSGASSGASSGAMAPNPSAPDAASSGAADGAQPSADASQGAAGSAAAPESGAASSGSDQSASAESGMSKDAGSSASGASSAPDQMAASDTGAAAASDGKAWPASYLVGATITNAPDGAEIGDLHFADNKVDKVTINHGGTLGVGEKQMEVAFNDLQISGDPTAPKVELQGDPLQQLNAAAAADKAKKDMSAPEK